MEPTFGSVPVLDLLLNRDNPRHTHKESQSDVIEYLVKDEEVYNLARHMGKNGLNPIEVVSVFPGPSGALIVAEGNRRICAAQLLTDPDKSPASIRARFRALADSKTRDVSRVNIARFPDYEAAQPWLQILHDGEQDGVGRKRWKPEQKARATTSKSTDALAVALLDRAVAEGVLTSEERQKARLSTVTRYLANPDVRTAMRIVSAASSDRVDTDVDGSVFLSVMTKFFRDLDSGKLHSRSKTEDWLAYAAELGAEFSSAPKKLQSSATGAPINSVAGTKTPKARLVVPDTRFVSRSPHLSKELNRISSFKLSNLYESLTSLSLEEHPSLLAIGA